MNILILIPGDNARGGITNYYASISNHLPQNIFYFKRGARNWPKKDSLLFEFFRIFFDYFKFLNIIIFKRISIIQTTTAFYKESIFRDSVFIILSKIFRKKVIVFFRGWNDEYVYNLSGFSAKLFKNVFFKADAFIDLSQKNVNHLKQIGYKKQIYLETTLVDQSLVKDVNIEDIIKERLKNKVKTILFLSRLEKAKGVYKLLEIYKDLKIQDNNFRLVFAGDGKESEHLKKEVNKQKINDVDFKGFVQGKEKQEIFKKADIFIFLSEFEGMPNAVLEAMAFGLPVITTNVGGIASVFQNNRNGILLENNDKTAVVNNIIEIIKNRELYYTLSKNNYYDSKEKVWSDVVAKRMLKIFNDTYNK